MAEKDNNKKSPLDCAIDVLAKASVLVGYPREVTDPKTKKSRYVLDSKPISDKDVFAHSVKDDGMVVVVTNDGQKYKVLNGKKVG